jgi:hypothetical protein
MAGNLIDLHDRQAEKLPKCGRSDARAEPPFDDDIAVHAGRKIGAEACKNGRCLARFGRKIGPHGGKQAALTSVVSLWRFRRRNPLPFQPLNV